MAVIQCPHHRASDNKQCEEIKTLPTAPWHDGPHNYDDRNSPFHDSNKRKTES